MVTSSLSPRLGHACGFAVSLIVLGCLLAGGCAYATSYVTLGPTLDAPMPETGDQVAVRVEDGRKGVSRYELGAKHVPAGWESNTIDLKEKEFLTDHVATDIVALLRERGFRARDSRRSPSDPADRTVVVRIEQFYARVMVGGGTASASAVFVVEALPRGTDQPPRKEMISTELSKKISLLATDADCQEVVEGLYREVLRQLREKIAAGFPQ